MKLKLLILVLALQCAWIAYTVATQEHALSHGSIILLETRRVDPRDLLRGDYLILDYHISDVPTNLFLPPVKKDLSCGTKIFVALLPGTNHFYQVSRASTNELVAGIGEVLVQGRSDGNRGNASNAVHVVYGIEKYFVAEGQGNPAGKLTVQAVVPVSGCVKIKEVFVDARPYADAMKDVGR